MAGNNPLHGRDEGLPFPIGAYYPPNYYYYQPAWAATYPTSYPLPAGSPLPPGPIYAHQPNGAHAAYARTPQPTAPQQPPTLPATQLRNTAGGTGCEPGYNYFFPPSHTKIHVFKSSTPPWRLGSRSSTAHIPFHAVHVPTGTTLAEILRGFGCDNPNPKKNRCYEIVQGGGGRWYKGMSFGGDDRDVGRKTIREIGWDETRNGQPGGKPVVCIYLTKD